MTTIPKADEYSVSIEEMQAAGWWPIDDDAIEHVGDMDEPTNVSAPSKAQHHCVND